MVEKLAPLWGEWYPEEVLGEGAFGRVWRVQNGSSICGAVKEVVIPLSEEVLRAAWGHGLTSDGARQYYRALAEDAGREIARMDKLRDCPNIVRVHERLVRELTEEEGAGWLVLMRMDFLTPFRELWLGGEMTVDRVAKLGIEIARALEACAEQGIVHRDVKPDNLFYDRENDRFQLGDFGIARELAEPTQGMMGAGTLTHLPPEVFRGEPYTCGADLYALGMIVYCLLNHNRLPLLPAFPEPFTPAQRDKAVARRLAGAEIELPSHARGAERTLAGRLGAIARKAITPEPGRRFWDAKHFRCAIEDAVGGADT